MPQIGAEGNSYITHNLTDSNRERYGDKYHSSRYVKQTATSHRGNEEEED